MCDILYNWLFGPPEIMGISFPSFTKKSNSDLNSCFQEIIACLEGRSARLQRALDLDKLHPRIFQLGILVVPLEAAIIPKRLIGKGVLIMGRVTRVGDPDNFRVFQKPWLRWWKRVPTEKELTGQTIHTRIGGADAPEAAHGGNRPAQKGSDKAWKWMEDTVLNKDVVVELEFKDQYKRIVGNVYLLPSYIPSFLLPFVPSTLLCSEARNISLLMIRAGWAHVYEDKNACYSGWGIEVFREAERAAKAKRLGVWKDGIKVETPASYKKRYNTPTPSPTIEPGDYGNEVDEVEGKTARKRSKRK